MKKLYKNIFYLVLMLVSVSACQSVKDGLSGNKKSGIVYCGSRKMTEQVAKILQHCLHHRQQIKTLRLMRRNLIYKKF